MKTLIGLIVILVVILGIIWYTRRNDSFLSNMLNRNNEEGVIVEEEQKEQPEVTSEETVVGSDQVSNRALLTCTPELLTQDCPSSANSPVCSIDTVTTADGTQTTNSVEYISACHYCKFFGADGKAEFGDETVTTKGYTVGSCATK